MKDGNIISFVNVLLFACEVGVVHVGTKVALRYNRHFALKKDASAKNISVDRLPESIKVTNKIPKEGIKKDIAGYIKKFISTLSKEGHIDLSNLYRNLRPFGIVSDKDFDEEVEAGSYDANKRLIVFDEDDKYSTVMMGLLECASTRETETALASGFERTRYKVASDGSKAEDYHIGFGLNYGYKQILLNRYFDYSYEDDEIIEIVSLIEHLVGRDEMESMFFSGNLRDLIDKIGKRCYSPNAGIECVKNIDYLYKVQMEESRIVTSLSEGTYRKLLCDISWALMHRIREIYLSSEDKDARLRALKMLNDLNYILSSREKVRYFKHGLHDDDYDKLKRHGDDIFEGLPEYYSVYDAGIRSL